ncbi:MAG: contact-dependent growth inhibition system immunity protein [Vicinamibacterales bacterium]
MAVVRRLRTRASRSSTAAPLTADRFPHLAAFLSGYLHQDFVIDHRTPADALQAFLREADAAQRTALREEWRALAAEIEGLAWRDVRDTIAALGGAWRPASRAALLALFDELP